MEIRTTSVPSSRYDDFLFAVICEDSNGTQLSVISALTRMGVDPWEEAARLETMAGTLAQKRLVSVLGDVSGQSWSVAQREAVASRLAGLLPSSKADANSMAASEISVRLLFCVVVWWSFLFATAVSTYYNKADGASASYSSATAPLPNSSTSSNARTATD
ncbi:hypothetical protein MTX26_25000 [Bradyrhizobium sp. ISRA443]|uniref:hypothetical protein n=1 Tax=unclassified Bradyrhizobium TaxID=2631580 RepID=UPI00247A00AB|nr:MULTISPECIES: hypothetical protein [unclassified Bradyrhizobium]WGR93126.1 hypothetical protein MTX20_35930 [Bradyrhizobium sp. ISRA435]WGR97635.1 hypothetical protein MTX23_24995 [Bradyrhizobium sp. ISRA436]WGS04525.1 hypothetical protein MTX18_25000 [Bradyrhizobium sp. ISRA437]WGS11406.1 hypothetical protein MTX26_25000 [Bradyrhizobium sp. ISRA443]